VSPVRKALNSLNMAMASFHPGAMPLLSRGHYRRELVAWFFLPIMLGAVEGGIVGVLAKNVFEGAATTRTLNLCVAALAGAPAFANVTSFLWAAMSHGRHKIRFLVALQIVTAVLIGLIAAAPRNGTGLLVVTACVIGARMCWSGVVTIRSTVWRMNYPRSDRATMAGKLATVQAVMLTLIGLAVGAAMNWNDDAFRVLYPAAAALGLVGTWFYGGMRMRGHRAMVNAERAERRARTGAMPRVSLWEVLRRDKGFRRYMTCMFVFGSGNQMVIAPLVIILRDRFRYEELVSILIASTIPTLLMPISIPIWSRLFNRMHIVQFRAWHSWTFVASIVAFLIGAVTLQPWLLVVGAVGKGVAFGGGILGWNLGHHDFSSPHQAGEYMGVHVTLTGVRGLFAPALAVGLYELFEGTRPGTGPWVFGCALALSLTGALGFILLWSSIKRGTVQTRTTTNVPAPRLDAAVEVKRSSGAVRRREARRARRPAVHRSDE
jgi:hypothetical protein